MGRNLDIFRRTLRAEAERLAFPLGPRELDAMTAHYELLGRWNQRARLTAAITPARAAVELFADCLVACRFAGSVCDRPAGAGLRLIDIGTGTGLPGIALKILQPGWSLTMIDSNTNKIAFIKTVVRELGLSDVTVLRGRAENLAHEARLRERFDLAFCRAVGPPQVVCELAVPFLSFGGIFILQTIESPLPGCKDGRAAAAPLDEQGDRLRRAAQEVGTTIYDEKSYILSGVSRTRTLVAIKKTSHTPQIYPRPPRIIKKNPLA